MSNEEKKYYTQEDLIGFLGIKFNFEYERKRDYPYWLKLEDLQFMWGRVVIPKGDIHEIVSSKIQDKEYTGKKELKMLFELPFKVIGGNDNVKGKIGIISVNIGLSFRYDKEYKYGDINHSLAEVCYYIEQHSKQTNDFYFIEDENVSDFMSYLVIDNQCWVGRDTVYSSVLFNYKGKVENE